MTPTSLDLRGPWLIRPDPDNVGLTQQWWQRRDAAPRSARSPVAAAPPPQPAGDWREINVPCAWQKVLGTNDLAVAWYRRRVQLAPNWLTSGQRAWLRFDAVATDARIWFNGIEVGRHVGDWAPFQFDVTDLLRVGAGDHEIVVRVDKIPATPPEWIEGAPVFGGHITKGFHDVLSIQHGGIWDGVTLFKTGQACAVPDGVQVIADPRDGSVSITVEIERCEPGATVAAAVLDPSGKQLAATAVPIAAGSRICAVKLQTPGHSPWSPSMPTLYSARVTLRDAAGAESQVHTIRFGFRRVETGGPKNQRLLLNGQPLFLRGVLDWGHEPEHMAPAPTPDEVRERFRRLRELGFNCVCICMWYPPRWFYDIADETGMLIWQEHPVWKSWMGDELVEEYKPQFLSFFRRDANHPSVVLVSGSCEHERFNPTLAEWWWTEARRRLPDRRLQIQTAFFAWTDPTKTDLWDEHTYDSSGRWVRYLDDLQLALAEREPKPFIMGESILYTSWPDIDGLTGLAKESGIDLKIDDGPSQIIVGSQEGQHAAGSIIRWRREDGDHVQRGDLVAQLESDTAVVELRAATSGVLKQEIVHLERVRAGIRVGMIVPDAGEPHVREAAIGWEGGAAASSLPWWFPKGLGELARFQHDLENRYGRETVERFRTHADRYHLQGRKFQMERYRSYPNHAGHVMNHLRDVPTCRCGFMDDLGRWRFKPEDMAPWLGDSPLLLWTPDHRRGFRSGQVIDCRLAVSNFGPCDISTRARLTLADGPNRADLGEVVLSVTRGEVGAANFILPLPAGDEPRLVTLRAATADPSLSNSWPLWLLPTQHTAGRTLDSSLLRLRGIDFVDARDRYPDFEEHAYSSGWGLKVRDWVCELPDPAKLCPDVLEWRFDAPMPEGARAIVTHRLTNALIEWLAAGGRVVHLASKGPGSIPTRYVSMWGQLPLILADRELGLAPAANDAILDLLDHDLTRRLTRAVPTGELGIAGDGKVGVAPVVRLVYTHDMQDRPKLLDAVFTARVGKGLLIVSSLDHSEDAGQWLLEQLLRFATEEKSTSGAELDLETLRRWTVETSAR